MKRLSSYGEVAFSTLLRMLQRDHAAGIRFTEDKARQYARVIDAGFDELFGEAPTSAAGDSDRPALRGAQ